MTERKNSIVLFHPNTPHECTIVQTPHSQPIVSLSFSSSASSSFLASVDSAGGVAILKARGNWANVYDVCSFDFHHTPACVEWLPSEPPLTLRTESPFAEGETVQPLMICLARAPKSPLPLGCGVLLIIERSGNGKFLLENASAPLSPPTPGGERVPMTSSSLPADLSLHSCCTFSVSPFTLPCQDVLHATATVAVGQTIRIAAVCQTSSHSVFLFSLSWDRLHSAVGSVSSHSVILLDGVIHSVSFVPTAAGSSLAALERTSVKGNTLRVFKEGTPTSPAAALWKEAASCADWEESALSPSSAASHPRRPRCWRRGEEPACVGRSSGMCRQFVFASDRRFVVCRTSSGRLELRDGADLTLLSVLSPAEGSSSDLPADDDWASPPPPAKRRKGTSPSPAAKGGCSGSLSCAFSTSNLLIFSLESCDRVLTYDVSDVLLECCGLGGAASRPPPSSSSSSSPLLSPVEVLCGYLMEYFTLSYFRPSDPFDVLVTTRECARKTEGGLSGVRLALPKLAKKIIEIGYEISDRRLDILYRRLHGWLFRLDWNGLEGDVAHPSLRSAADDFSIALHVAIMFMCTHGGLLSVVKGIREALLKAEKEAKGIPFYSLLAEVGKRWEEGCDRRQHSRISESTLARRLGPYIEWAVVLMKFLLVMVLNSSAEPPPLAHRLFLGVYQTVYESRQNLQTLLFVRWILFANGMATRSEILKMSTSSEAEIRVAAVEGARSLLGIAALPLSQSWKELLVLIPFSFSLEKIPTGSLDGVKSTMERMKRMPELECLLSLECEMTNPTRLLENLMERLELLPPVQIVPPTFQTPQLRHWLRVHASPLVLLGHPLRELLPPLSPPPVELQSGGSRTVAHIVRRCVLCGRALLQTPPEVAITPHSVLLAYEFEPECFFCRGAIVTALLP